MTCPSLSLSFQVSGSSGLRCLAADRGLLFIQKGCDTDSKIMRLPWQHCDMSTPSMTPSAGAECNFPTVSHGPSANVVKVGQLTDWS